MCTHKDFESVTIYKIYDKTADVQLTSLPKSWIFYTNAVCDVCDILQVWGGCCSIIFAISYHTKLSAYARRRSIWTISWITKPHHVWSFFRKSVYLTVGPCTISYLWCTVLLFVGQKVWLDYHIPPQPRLLEEPARKKASVGGGENTSALLAYFTPLTLNVRC